MDTLSIVLSKKPFDLLQGSTFVCSVRDDLNLPYPERVTSPHRGDFTKDCTVSVYGLAAPSIIDKDERTYDEHGVWTATENFRDAGIVWLPKELTAGDCGHTEKSGSLLWYKNNPEGLILPETVARGTFDAANTWAFDGKHLRMVEYWVEQFPGKPADKYLRKYDYLVGTGMLGFEDLLNGLVYSRA